MSFVVPSLIGAVTAIVSLVAGEKYITQQSGNNLLVKNTATGQTVASIPLTLKPVTFFKGGIGRTSSAVTEKPLTPQIQFVNPYKDKKVTVVNISIVPDAGFKLHGMVRIDINGRAVLDPQPAGTFTDLTDFQIPLPDEGAILDEGLTIDVYVWTDNVANTVNLTASFGVLRY